MILKDADEAEWEAFQKEIAVEVAASADLAATDQLEETVDRQLEEIDDQMRAWSRVRNIEIRKDDVDTKLRDKKTGVQNDIKTVVKTENSDDEVKFNLKSQYRLYFLIFFRLMRRILKSSLIGDRRRHEFVINQYSLHFYLKFLM